MSDIEDIKKEMREIGIPNVDDYSVHELRAWKTYANIIGNLEDTIEKLDEEVHVLSREVREMEQSIQDRVEEEE